MRIKDTWQTPRKALLVSVSRGVCPLLDLVALFVVAVPQLQRRLRGHSYNLSRLRLMRCLYLIESEFPGFEMTWRAGLSYRLVIKCKFCVI